ncbi:hypothetical protein M408DRAFT_326814 [Serendipita vermifera MAFF 305830]|uniref:Transmembrane protein n=1 Tax=Serendipita vermifera MAFF 305830 TaxID=933852 RepID=A0A0C3B5Q4_SERVB|nr:hypothetical protein M408DRAFT_326814 [Serendipita vermifera MAFF 305830]
MRINTTIDDVSPLITYAPASRWSAGTRNDVKWTEYYLNTYTMCSRAGDNATFTFTGTGVWLYGALRDNHGLYNVTLDGATVTRDGIGAGEGLYQQVLFGASDLSPGTHTVVLTNNQNSTRLANLDLDFIIFEEELGGATDTLNSTKVDDGDAAFTYGPASTAWNTIPDNVQSFEGSTGHTTVSTAAYVDYAFTGNAATVFGVLGPSQGPYSVAIDGGAGTNYTALSANFLPKQILYHVTGLTDGAHTIRISNLPATTGQALTIDYAVADAIQVPIVTTSSTSLTSTSSSTSTSETSSSTEALPTETPPPTSSGPSTGVIVAAVVGGIALFALISFALMMFRRRRASRKDLDEKPDMAIVWPEPYSVGNEGYGGSGRYIPPSQNMQDGYNPLNSEGSPLYPPNRNVHDVNAPGYFGQHVDGTSLFSGFGPGQPPRQSTHSGTSNQPSRGRRPSNASTRLPYIQSEVDSVSPYGRDSAYTANSDGTSRIPAHGHGTMTDMTEPPPVPPLPRTSPTANSPRNLGLHNPPPLHTGLIPPRKGQQEAVRLPPSAAPDQVDAFRGLTEEQLRERRMNVQGREQDFGPLRLDDDEPVPTNAPLPPDYTQATETFKR